MDRDDDLRFSFGWKIIQENIVKTSMHQKHLIFAWKWSSRLKRLKLRSLLFQQKTDCAEDYIKISCFLAQSQKLLSLQRNWSEIYAKSLAIKNLHYGHMEQLIRDGTGDCKNRLILYLQECWRCWCCLVCLRPGPKVQSTSQFWWRSALSIHRGPQRGIFWSYQNLSDFGIVFVLGWRY